MCPSGTRSNGNKNAEAVSMRRFGIFASSFSESLALCKRTARLKGVALLVASDEDLVDAVVVDVEYFERIVGADDFVRALRNLAQHVHHEARNCFVGGVFGQFVDFECMLQVIDRSRTVDKPRILIALNDLNVVGCEYEVAHHG